MCWNRGVCECVWTLEQFFTKRAVFDKRAKTMRHEQKWNGTRIYVAMDGSGMFILTSCLAYFRVFYLTNLLPYLPTFYLTHLLPFFWPSMWHIFWRSKCPILWQSICHSISLTFWQSIWHSMWQSMWHNTTSGVTQRDFSDEPRNIHAWSQWVGTSCPLGCPGTT